MNAPRLKVLLELRPAFDGHSGIPQETRMLFSGLAQLQGVEVVGLIQSSNLVAEAGLPLAPDGGATPLADADKIDRLSKVVVSLQQGPGTNRLEMLRRRLLLLLGPAGAALGSLFGARVRLGGFEPTHFKDFLWRGLFAKSLPDGDFAVVTAQAFRVMRWPLSALHAVGVMTRFLGHALYVRLDTRGMAVMVVETPFPGRVRTPTRMVVRYHDAIPLLLPHTIKARAYHRAAHFNALRRNARDGAWFACVSDATRQDLLAVMPDLASRAVTIPNMVSHHFFAEPSMPTRVPEVIWSRKNRRAPHRGGADVAADEIAAGPLPFLLMVGTVEPRKNHLALLDAWELLRAAGHPQLHLVFVGSLGWGHDAILDRFMPWLERGGLHLLHDVPAADLRLLYRHARVTVCPSLAEGFDFPGVEAMRSGGVVAASDIAVHRGVFGDACAYFDPYSTQSMEACLQTLVGGDCEARRAQLQHAGDRVAQQYLPERVMPLWGAFLQTVAAAP